VEAEMLAAKALVEATQHEVLTQLKEVKAWTECSAYQRTGTGLGAVKPPKFDESASRAVFRLQFDMIAEHKYWAPRERATYLIADFQGQASMCYTEP
jgi:hypothetical protein